MSEIKPRLGFVGPLLGSNPGWTMSQGEIVANLFANTGYQVRLTSNQTNTGLRLLDMITSLISWRKKIDTIILSVFSGRGFYFVDVASSLAKMLGFKQIHVLRGGALPEFSQAHSKWVRRVCHQADALVSPSGFLVQAFTALGFSPILIPNVLNLTQYPYRQRVNVQPNLLWMRSFQEVYHPEMAVAVLHQLLSDYPQARLTMAGHDRGGLTAVKILAQQLNLEDKVHFAGFLDTTGKQQQYAQNDIYLHTNRIDNMPVSVVEAAAFGLPIVATRVGGIPYLLEEEQTSLLVENEDAAGMTTAVKRLLQTPELAARLSKQGRQLAETCAWTAVKPQWEALFANL